MILMAHRATSSAATISANTPTGETNVTSKLRSWLLALPDVTCVPLFETSSELIVQTHVPASGNRRVCRSKAMENAVLDAVAKGLNRPSWRGLLYVMAWGSRDGFRPLYIGKAGRFGKTHGQLSANLKNLGTDKSKFARWGDGNDYHIGDLSQALYGWSAYKDPCKKYLRWAEMLFVEKSPLRLREPTNLILIPWDEGQLDPDGEACSLEAAEDRAIELATAEFRSIVLNVQGETWRAPAAATVACVPSRTFPRRPYSLITSEDGLTRAVDDLSRESVIGLDVETTLYRQELCLVQIATRTHTYIVDPISVRSIEPLRQVLGSMGPLKVIHNASFERRVLGEVGFQLEKVFDTLATSRRLGPSKAGHGLAAVCARHLGRHLDKSLQKSHWDRRPLSREQLEYAAIDAEVLLDLHEFFERRLPQAGVLFPQSLPG